MFEKKYITFRGESAILVITGGECDLADTFECGQAFRYECTAREPGYAEYVTVVGDKVLRVGQEKRGELIFFGLDDESFEATARPYFALDTDFEAIREEIKSLTDSEWLRRAADAARGIIILKQDPWEALFSFIISQNNNIPRIRKIIRAISAEYGENLAKASGSLTCPLDKNKPLPDDAVCRACGACYSFPSADAVAKKPDGLLPSHPGFRYKYLVDAAKRVTDGRTDLKDISDRGEYEYTRERLKEILGVGDKVAACVALFGFSNLEAFPIDVWMKRAIDEYFGGKLDPTSLGKYAGVAQQYIFHYIRNLEKEQNM